jgi:chromosome segregation ATPase
MTDLATDLPPLRYSRFGGGYRREDVESALRQLLQTMREVEANLDRLRAGSAELETELRSARDEIDAYRGREEHLLTLIERAERLLSQLEGEEDDAHQPAPEISEG